MLFFQTYKPKAGFTHEDQKLMLNLWAQWTPPEGIEIKSFHVAPDGRGFLLIEGATAEAMYEGMAPWSNVLLDYEVVPVIDVETSLELLSAAVAKREAA